MNRAVDDLWTVALDASFIDADVLSSAVEAAARDEASMDYRTRLLVRDSVRALELHWGAERFRSWIKGSPRRQQIEKICAVARIESHRDRDARGFPTLTRRVVDAIKPETVLQFLRELSTHVHTPTRLLIGRSIALILPRYIVRRTDDIDVVDEVPAELRKQHDVLGDLATRFGLRLTHFQSHYLPDGWDQRIHSIGTFDKLHAFRVDAYDVFVGKLFSGRNKTVTTCVPSCRNLTTTR